jgi:signal transduction histidine kinase
MVFSRFLSSRLQSSAEIDRSNLVSASENKLDTSVEWRAERTRIAQELHDTLLQGFFSVSMQLRVAVDGLPEDCPTKARFGDILQLLDRVLEEGRCAVQGLRSPDGAITSLGQAFAGIPNDLGLPSSSGFRVIVQGRERKLKPGLGNEVYRIGREAIVNACRHARARDIETEVEYRARELRIAVRDDGCGIDRRVLQWDRKGHWGLRGMHERAERIGAQICINSKVAFGTEVVLCVPGIVAFEQPGDPGGLLQWLRSLVRPWGS